MKTSQQGQDLIKKWEGLKLRAYDDGGGVWTIGYGHTKGVKRGDRISLSQAEVFFQDDLREHEQAVIDLVKQPLSQGQFDALVCFTFNVGVSAFAESTLLKRVNAGKVDDVPAQLMRWVHDKDKKTGEMVVVEGLVNRRKAECELWRGYSNDITEGARKKPSEPKGKPITKSSTAWAAGLSGVSAAGAVASQITEAVNNINGLAKGILTNPVFWLSLAAIGAAVWIIKERKRIAREFGA